MTFIVVRKVVGLSKRQWQAWLGTVKCLDRAPLVDWQDDLCIDRHRHALCQRKPDR